MDSTEIELLAASPLLLKLLGPTADYLGEGARSWTEKGAENLKRVFENAQRKLGADQLNRPGAVPPKVLKGILEEGQFSDDELTAEYLGGVLASSRSEISRDDRGAALTSLIGRLSTYQLRTHYIFYALAQRALAGTVGNLWLSSVRDQVAQFYLGMDSYVAALALSSEEAKEFGGILDHVLGGLIREDLLSNNYGFGDPETLRTIAPHRDYPNFGLVFTITPLGIELFAAVHGVTNARTSFVGPSEQFRIEADIALPETITPVMALPVWSPPPSPDEQGS